MSQLPGIFIYLCAAAFVPILIARTVVRAEWRTVRNASLIWYGFLILAFGGFKSEEGFGWALIFAMFFSIVAIPIVSLVMKVWNRLGRSSEDIGPDSSRRRWWQRFPRARMSAAQAFAVASLLAGVALFAYWQEQRDLSARATALQQFFGLPTETEIAEIRPISKSPVTAPRVEAIVRFTEPQFKAHAGTLDGPRHWQQGTPRFDGAPVEVVAPETLKWQALPVPAFAGNRRVGWSRLTENARSENATGPCVVHRSSENAQA